MPTVEEFLTYVPKRGDFPWSETDEGLVIITVPKFNGKLGKSFCKVLRRQNTFDANLDSLGSCIWKHCDGVKTVKEILETITKEFPFEKNIDQRLFLFLQQLRALNYIQY
ncbi:MAG: pyrroloquinoline quinone biosynthesis protein PqqD [Thermoplasmata archaeon M11B2D]|nr:MAG: pyrroloquinoline quinone biosynthesis protein PqqD [Thermoplasmata archaeon M11B2D]PNX54028.1 MAG: pyrroloquinoline quinone biosynthesis protein PqqD [Thermoplasmata archaeon M9B2D]